MIVRITPCSFPKPGLIPENAKYLYAVIGHGGIGFSPFGIDDNSLSPPNRGHWKSWRPMDRNMPFSRR